MSNSPRSTPRVDCHRPEIPPCLCVGSFSGNMFAPAKRSETIAVLNDAHGAGPVECLRYILFRINQRG